jgi:deoxyribonuclease V
LLVGVLGMLKTRPAIVVIDGYVWLDEGRPGLGARLFEALGGRTPVVGIAKTAFRDAGWARAVVRGRSAKPLFVTAAGLGLDDAAEGVRSMAGAHRLPAMVAEADRLARGALTA